MEDVIIIGGGPVGFITALGRHEHGAPTARPVFRGNDVGERFVATNVYYDFERYGYARATFVIDDSFGAVIAILNNKGLWRCTSMEDATLPEETFLERLPQVYEAILPGQGPYEFERASPYRMHQRSAPLYRVGRVLLAGDAAHVANPTGGLGLTSGLFDSYALYPALTAVILEVPTMKCWIAIRRRAGIPS